MTPTPRIALRHALPSDAALLQTEHADIAAEAAIGAVDVGIGTARTRFIRGWIQHATERVTALAFTRATGVAGQPSLGERLGIIGTVAPRAALPAHHFRHSGKLAAFGWERIRALAGPIRRAALEVLIAEVIPTCRAGRWAAVAEVLTRATFQAAAIPAVT